MPARRPAGLPGGARHRRRAAAGRARLTPESRHPLGYVVAPWPSAPSGPSTSPTCSKSSSTPLPERLALVAGDRAPAPTPSSTSARQPVGPPPDRPRHRARRPRGDLLVEPRRVGRGDDRAATRPARCRSTSTTATSRPSCAYLFDNADLRGLDLRARVLAAGRGRSRPSCRSSTRSSSIEDGTEPDGSLAGLDAVAYEDALAARRPRTRLRAAQPRRPLHALHRRHHRHAQGRDVAAARTSSSPRSAAARRRARRSTSPEDARGATPSNGRRRSSFALAPLMHGGGPVDAVVVAHHRGQHVVL